MLGSPLGQRSRRLTLKINNHKIQTGIQDLAQMIIAVTSDTLGLKISVRQRTDPGQQLPLQFEHESGLAPLGRAEIGESPAK